jgi:transcription factor IIIB subunit 2
VCTDCGGTVIEYDQAAGNGFCVQCGTVVEENTIVNEVAFGEASNGAAIVQGSFVGQGASTFLQKSYSSIDPQVHQRTQG